MHKDCPFVDRDDYSIEARSREVELMDGYTPADSLFDLQVGIVAVDMNWVVHSFVPLYTVGDNIPWVVHSFPLLSIDGDIVFWVIHFFELVNIVFCMDRYFALRDIVSYVVHCSLCKDCFCMS